MMATPILENALIDRTEALAQVVRSPGPEFDRSEVTRS
jgi:hypothetical protein